MAEESTPIEATQPQEGKEPETNEQPEEKKEIPVEPEPKHHWWNFRKKKKASDEAKDDDKPEKLPDKPTDSLEANLKAMAAHMEVKERNDYWHIKLDKKWTLILGGLIILGLWGYYGFNRINHGRQWSLKGVFLVSEKEVLPPTPTPLPQVVIRIRYKTPAQASPAAALAQQLGTLGFPVTDVVLDDQSEFDGVMVIGKNSQIELRDKLEGILAQSCPLASPGAELTPDSDFDAVILFAPTATQAAGVQ